MKKIERGTINYLIVLIITTAILGIIIYPIFDLVYCKLIAKTEFVYSLSNHIIQPVLFAIIFGITYWVVDKRKK